MTFTDYLIDITLIGLVLLQVRGRRLTTRSMLIPLGIVAYVAMTYLHGIPTAGNDVILVVGCATMGALLGGLAGFFTSVSTNPDGVLVAKAGLAAAGLWVLGTGARLPFQVYATHGRLVHEGLDEARGAVQALRDDTPALGEQLSRLCSQHHAAFTTNGDVQPLMPKIVMGLYRVTQEALTNVMKHAPGALACVTLSYGPQSVSITVDNASTEDRLPLCDSGGGYGLRGITERLALLGGHVEAGPFSDGWRVAAAVPVGAGSDSDDGAPVST